MQLANLNSSLHFQQPPSSAPVPNPVSVLPRLRLPDTHIRHVPPRPAKENAGKWLTLAAAACSAAMLSCALNAPFDWPAVEQLVKATRGHAAPASAIARCEGGKLRSAMCQIAYEGGIPELFGN